MKRGVLSVVLSTALLMLLMGCGGGSGGSDGSGSSGTLSVNATDAQPALPVNGATVTNVFVTIDEVSAHKAGGGWVKLTLAESPPYTIDLLQFINGKTTQLVPPMSLESGKYTQIRLGVTGGKIVFDTDDDQIGDSEEPLEVPSDNLKTDKNFDFEVQGGGAVDLTVDFDLSQSIVVEGTGTYKLKPVLHVVQTEEAATIEGTIKNTTFGPQPQQGNPSKVVEVTVIWDKNGDGIADAYPVDEVYTKVYVTQDTSGQQQEFSVFWLVPNQNYIVQVKADTNDSDDTVDTVVYDEPVHDTDLQAGAVKDLGLI
jgi:Domain of unknown function (DUF4382)